MNHSLFLPGSECLIQTLDGNTPAAHRLAEMGVLPGSQLHVVRLSPLGDTLEVRMEEGETLALRRTDLEHLGCTFTALPLNLALEKFSNPLRIRHLLGGRSFGERMAQQGLQPGTRLQVLNRTPHRILCEQETGKTVELGAGEAVKIIVEPLEGDAVNEPENP
jgi:ferrous iron transport protein A